MKSSEEIIEELYKSRKLQIENEIFYIRLRYNYMGLIMKFLTLLLILIILSFGYWLGWFIYK